MFPPSTSYYHVRGIKWQLHFLLCCSKVNDHFIFCKGSINLEEVCRNKKRVILIWTKWLADDLDVNEIIVLTANLDYCNDIEPGDIIWAKLTGHAVWPAIVRYESFVSIRRGLSKISGEKSVLLRNGVGIDLEGDGKKDEGSGNSKKMCLSTELIETKFKGTNSAPFIVGDLEVLKLASWLYHATSDHTYFDYVTGTNGESFANWGSPTWFSWDDKLPGTQTRALIKGQFLSIRGHAERFGMSSPPKRIIATEGVLLTLSSLGDALRPAHGWLCKSKGSFVPISSMCKDKLENTALEIETFTTAKI
ncbi:histone-lysine N-methyltransferase ATX2-like protein isoform X1 [Tanacetum coccineum]